MILTLTGLFLVLVAGITLGFLFLPMVAAVLLTAALVFVGGWVLDRLRRPEPKGGAP